MEWFDSGWGLTLIVFIPTVAAAILLAIPRSEEGAAKMIALVASLISFFLSVVAIFQFDFGRADQMQLGTKLEWITSINANYAIGIDGISLPLMVLSTFVVVLAIIYSWDHWPEPHNPKAFLILILFLATGMAGTFVARDLVLFFIFFELVLLPMYFMIGVWGDKQQVTLPIVNRVVEMRLYASIKFFLFTLFGSAFMLLGFLALYFKSGDSQLGIRTFDIEVLSDIATRVDPGFLGSAAPWIFAALFLGFAVKVPMWPLHTWLPDAHTAAPTVGSVLLAAILLKLGTYGFVRISLPILPEQSMNWAPIIAVLAVISIIYGSLACLAQTDMKRLIAFSSVGHMGFVMLGISTMTTIGINAAVIGMVAHGIITGLLFFVAGSMSHRYHTREMSRLGGNLKLMPVMGGILGFTAMASLGLPGLAGFWGEFMALVGAFNPLDGLDLTLFRTAMVIGAIGTVLTAGYLLWMLQKVNLGEPKAEWASVELHDVERTELLAWVPLLVAIVALGVYPKIVLGATDPAVANIVENITRAVGS
ncbi:MAG: NADH-quinone oxidoreductase subunit M [Acidimicrobiia bacterium]|nr:NADH-quinone oxidoreductase subunit M [Acidimicrobiia bacterium]NNL28319.1 NADH-quinone oxidoreductase subunit M [Acidimicrobiia bacterium]